MAKDRDHYTHDPVTATTSLDEYSIEYEAGPCHKTGRYLMYVFNAIFFAFASLLFSLCLWTKFHKDIDDYVSSVSFLQYWDGVVVLMVGAMVVMVAVFVGACGTYFWNMRLICAYVVTCIISFIMNLAGATYLLSLGMESTEAYPHIQENFRALIWQYIHDTEAKRIVDNIQENIGCCGGYSDSDWDEIHMPVPNSCRDQVTGNQYRDSCAEVLSWYLEFRTAWISGIALCICFLQLFTLLFALCMYRGTKQMRVAYEDSNLEAQEWVEPPPGRGRSTA